MAEIRVDREGPVATVVIDRLDKHNAFTAPMLRTLRDEVEAADRREDVKVLVITGAGDRAFSAGADLRELRDLDPASARAVNQLWIDALLAIERAAIPVVASVNGSAMGGGMELVLACDLALAGDNARFGLVETRVGIVPGAGAAVRLSRYVGRSTAKEILMFGDVLDASAAHSFGLVNRVIPAGDLRTATSEFAGELASRSRAVLRAAKRAVNYAAELDVERGIDWMGSEFALLFGTADQREGMDAFLERRPPRFGDAG